MFDDQNGCEWVSVSSIVPAHAGSSGITSVKLLCVCLVVRNSKTVTSLLNLAVAELSGRVQITLRCIPSVLRRAVFTYGRRGLLLQISRSSVVCVLGTRGCAVQKPQAS